LLVVLGCAVSKYIYFAVDYALLKKKLENEIRCLNIIA